MRIYCTKSGTTLNLSFASTEKLNQSCFHNKVIHGQHPIFQEDVPISFLLGRVKDWQIGLEVQSNRMNANETWLLFLALLNATELVDFRVPAKYDNKKSPQIIYNNMDSLAKFVGWLHYAARPELVFNKYAITNTTCDLEGIHSIIRNWWETIDQWKNGYKRQLHQHKLQAIEDRLERLIRAPLPTEDSPDYMRRLTQLSNWAMVAANVPEERHEEWTNIIRTRPSSIEVFKLDVLEVKDMIDYMHDHLTNHAGGIYSHAFFAQLRQLEQRVAGGLQSFVGELEETDINGVPFRIVDEVEASNIALVAADAPEDEPQPENYPNRYLYLKAKASYALAQSARERLDNERAIDIAKMEKDNNTNPDIVTEEDMLDEGEDVIEEILRSSGSIAHDE